MRKDDLEGRKNPLSFDETRSAIEEILDRTADQIVFEDPMKTGTFDPVWDMRQILTDEASYKLGINDDLNARVNRLQSLLYAQMKKLIEFHWRNHHKPKLLRPLSSSSNSSIQLRKRFKRKFPTVELYLHAWVSYDQSKSLTGFAKKTVTERRKALETMYTSMLNVPQWNQRPSISRTKYLLIGLFVYGIGSAVIWEQLRKELMQTVRAKRSVDV